MANTIKHRSTSMLGNKLVARIVRKAINDVLTGEEYLFTIYNIEVMRALTKYFRYKNLLCKFRYEKELLSKNDTWIPMCSFQLFIVPHWIPRARSIHDRDTYQ